MSTELWKLMKAAEAAGPFRPAIRAPRFELSNTILTKIRRLLEEGGGGSGSVAVANVAGVLTTGGLVTATAATIGTLNVVGNITAGNYIAAPLTVVGDFAADSTASIHDLQVQHLTAQEFIAGALTTVNDFAADSTASINFLHVQNLTLDYLLIGPTVAVEDIVVDTAASIERLTTKEFRQSMVELAYSGCPILDVTAGNVYSVTIVSDTTGVSIIGGIAGSKLTLLLSQSGGDFSVVWPDNVLWPETTAPSLCADGNMDVFSFFNIDGSRWVGAQAGWFDV